MSPCSLVRRVRAPPMEEAVVMYSAHPPSGATALGLETSDEVTDLSSGSGISMEGTMVPGRLQPKILAATRQRAATPGHAQHAPLRCVPHHGTAGAGHGDQPWA